MSIITLYFIKSQIRNYKWAKIKQQIWTPWPI